MQKHKQNSHNRIVAATDKKTARQGELNALKAKVDFDFDSKKLTLCRRILTKREEHGYKILELAEILDKSRNSITGWENNELPPLEVLLKLCMLYDVEIGYFLGEHNEDKRLFADVKKEVGLSVEAYKKLKNHTTTNDNTGYYSYDLPHSSFIDIRNKFIEHFNFDNIFLGMGDFFAKFEEMIIDQIIHYSCYGDDMKNKNKVKKTMLEFIDVPEFKHDDFMAKDVGGIMYLMSQYFEKAVTDTFKGLFVERFEIIYEVILNETKGHLTKAELDTKIAEEMERRDSVSDDEWDAIKYAKIDEKYAEIASLEAEIELLRRDVNNGN